MTERYRKNREAPGKACRNKSLSGTICSLFVACVMMCGAVVGAAPCPNCGPTFFPVAFAGGSDLPTTYTPGLILELTIVPDCEGSEFPNVDLYAFSSSWENGGVVQQSPSMTIQIPDLDDHEISIVGGVQGRFDGQDCGGYGGTAVLRLRRFDAPPPTPSPTPSPTPVTPTPTPFPTPCPVDPSVNIQPASNTLVDGGTDLIVSYDVPGFLGATIGSPGEHYPHTQLSDTEILLEDVPENAFFVLYFFKYNECGEEHVFFWFINTGSKRSERLQIE